MQISVKSDVDKALKSMRGLQRKQMPFAAALGLTMTAKKVAKVEQRMMVGSLAVRRRLETKRYNSLLLTSDNTTPL